MYIRLQHEQHRQFSEAWTDTDHDPDVLAGLASTAGLTPNEFVAIADVIGEHGEMLNDPNWWAVRDTILES